MSPEANTQPVASPRRFSKKQKYVAGTLATGALLGAGAWVGNKTAARLNQARHRAIEIKRNMEAVEQLGGKINKVKDRWASFKNKFRRVKKQNGK